MQADVDKACRAVIVVGRGRLDTEASVELVGRFGAVSEVESVVFDVVQGANDLGPGWLLRITGEDGDAPTGTVEDPERSNVCFVASTESFDYRRSRLEEDQSDRGPGWQEIGGVRKVSFHRRVPGITHDAYIGHYRAHVAADAVHHANATRYRQNIIADFRGESMWLVDGISEHWYSTLEVAQERHFAQPGSREVVEADVSRWIDLHRAWTAYGRAWRSGGQP